MALLMAFFFSPSYGHQSGSQEQIDALKHTVPVWSEYKLGRVTNSKHLWL